MFDSSIYLIGHITYRGTLQPIMIEIYKLGDRSDNWHFRRFSLSARDSTLFDRYMHNKR